ncbi:MAG: hypothetical protein GX330_01690 [Bacteroidales bacterium]|nr:hypothetical protein [Bacteroidales bacterium]
MIYIYIPTVNERIRYIFHYVFSERLGLPYTLLENKEDFDKNTAAEKMVYATEYTGECLYVQAQPLLFENDIREQNVSISWENDLPICFHTQSENSLLSFDIFAACFCFLSRYEEYLTTETDQHGRYKAENSFAYKHNVLQIALVDRWIAYFASVLKKHFPALTIQTPSFRFIPTYDIDHAFLYKHKSCYLTFAGMCKQLLTGNFKALKTRIKVIINKIQDPYDTFSYLENLHKKYNLQPIFFILFAKRSKYDKNNSIKNKKFTTLIQQLGKNTKIGIHASYASDFSQNSCFEIEKNSLQQILSQSIQDNRQHFIRLKIPQTYTSLIKSGITNDYSMGYVSQIGFRAGTSFPFNFFDLKENKTTSLRIHPFLFMENALLSLENTSLESVWEAITPCLEEVKTHNGQLVTLFHNPSFAEGNSIDFKSLYEKIIEFSLQ